MGSVKQTKGDSLELLSLSLVLDVRHSAGAQERVTEHLKTCLNSLRKKKTPVPQHLHHYKEQDKGEVLCGAAAMLLAISGKWFKGQAIGN